MTPDPVPAPAGEAPDVRAIRARLRCEITRHLCGTDTLMVRDGVPVWCCATCELHAALGASGAPGRDAPDDEAIDAAALKAADDAWEQIEATLAPLREVLAELDADTEHSGWRSWAKVVAVVESARTALGEGEPRGR